MIFIFISGCSLLPTPADSAESLAPVILQPYATQTVFLLPTPTLFQTQIPLPSATPFIYTITKNDTLGEIAERFNIQLKDLLTANPGVVAETLFVGQEIRIPASSEDAQAIAAPTPAGIVLQQPVCFPSGSGVYCLVLAYNPFSTAIENAIAQVNLLDTDGKLVVSQPAYTPLNIIPAGQSLPLVTFFANQTITAQAAATLQNSTLLINGDARYLPVSASQIQIEVDTAGTTASVKGVLKYFKDAPAAGNIWLAFVAYGADGRVTGVRRWEWQGNLPTGETLEFVGQVFSYGPAIERVDVLVEARPVP